MEEPKKLKILYVITKSNWGGAQRNVFDLVSAMKMRGFETVVALGGEGVLKQKLEAGGVRTVSIGKLQRDMSLSKDFGSLQTIYSIIKAERPDILHLHSPKAAGLGALAGRLYNLFQAPSSKPKARIIYTVHGWTFNEDRPFYERWAIAFFSWLTVMLAHKTILLSEREYKQALYLLFLLFRKDKLALIPLGIKLPVFMASNEARGKIGKRISFDISKGFVIGTIAELHPNKGLTCLINAMEEVGKQYPNTVCIIIGEGRERTILEKLARMSMSTPGVDIDIRFTGYIDEASQYLKAFDVFVLPSVKEGLPYVILETGAAGLPVIASNVGGIPEIIEDKKSGLLVQPKNQDELERALSFMIEHPEERSKYGAALKEVVATKFSFEKMLTSTENLYKSP